MSSGPTVVHPSQGGEELPLQAVPVPMHAALWEKAQGHAVSPGDPSPMGLAALGAKAARQAAANDIAFDTYITDCFICHRAAPLPSAVT